MDFLLECIGFPPDQDLESLARLTRERGEPVAWRGPQGEHLRLPLAPGLDLRLDREEGKQVSSLYPHYQAEQRLRVAVDQVRELPDSPYDALLIGRANPPARVAPPVEEETFAICCVLTDARRLPQRFEPGRVLALSLAGFALDVEQVAPTLAGPGEGSARAFRDGGWIEPLGGAEDPGGCVELGLRVREVTRFDNPVSGKSVARVEVEAPGRPLTLFLSPWQLAVDGLPAPEPGVWIAGTFLLSGRVAGGLQGPSARLGGSFG